MSGVEAFHRKIDSEALAGIHRHAQERVQDHIQHLYVGNDASLGGVSVYADGNQFDLDLVRNELRIPEDAFNIRVGVTHFEVQSGFVNVVAPNNQIRIEKTGAGAFVDTYTFLDGSYSVELFQEWLARFLVANSRSANAVELAYEPGINRVLATFLDNTYHIRFDQIAGIGALLGFAAADITAPSATDLIAIAANPINLGLPRYIQLTSSAMHTGSIHHNTPSRVLAKIYNNVKVGEFLTQDRHPDEGHLIKHTSRVIRADHTFALRDQAGVLLSLGGHIYHFDLTFQWQTMKLRRG